LFLMVRVLDLAKPAAWIALVVIEGFVGLFAALVYFGWNHNRKVKVVLFRDGFVFMSKDQEEVFRYEEVTSVSTHLLISRKNVFFGIGFEQGRQYTDTIRGAGNKKVVIGPPLNRFAFEHVGPKIEAQ